MALKAKKSIVIFVQNANERFVKDANFFLQKHKKLDKNDVIL